MDDHGLVLALESSCHMCASDHGTYIVYLSSGETW